ncbi:hypothetical protein EXIGLDRAFT_441850 [Exidia glandulosa HHB12029]|uniref:Uncharacterized protein n=1 Tax=Exidia glandulosa HHB12029 TaxID=1314781 RepID=A0A165KB97_EXIGL|nr:hypothetical protein EXIGLDRAFT_441850 [Exidia glandulosa HHB12029]
MDELSIGVAVSRAGTGFAPASIARRAPPQEQGVMASFADAAVLRPEASPLPDVAPVVHAAVAPHTSFSAEEASDDRTNVLNNTVSVVECSARVVVASQRSATFPLTSFATEALRPEAERLGCPTADFRVANCDAVLVAFGSSVPGVTSTATAADGTSLVRQTLEHAARVDEYTGANAPSSHNIVDHDNLSASQVTLAGAGVVGSSVPETTIAAPLPGQPTVRVEPWQGYMIFDAFPYDEGGPRVPFDRDELPTDLAFFH